MQRRGRVTEEGVGKGDEKHKKASDLIKKDKWKERQVQ